MLVGKAPPLRVDLDRAFHHQRPGDQHPVRMGQRAMALAAAQLPARRAHRLAPQHGIASVTRVAIIERAGHAGDKPCDQLRVAAIAVAGQHQRLAGDGLAPAARPGQRHRAHSGGLVQMQHLRMRLGDQRDAGGLDGGDQAGEQRLAGALGHRMHAVATVAGIEEVGQHLPFQPVRVGEPVERRPDLAGGKGDQRLVGCPLGLGLDVGGKAPGVVVGYPRRALRGRRRRGNEAGGHRCGAGGRGVALHHHHLGAGIVSGQRRGEAAGACADHQYVCLDVGRGRDLPRDRRCGGHCRAAHLTRPRPAPAPRRRSAPARPCRDRRWPADASRARRRRSRRSAPSCGSRAHAHRARSRRRRHW